MPMLLREVGWAILPVCFTVPQFFEGAEAAAVAAGFASALLVRGICDESFALIFMNIPRSVAY